MPARLLGLLAASVVTIGGSALPALAEETPRNYWGWGHMLDGGWFFGPVAMLLFWGVLIALVVMAVRWASGSSQTRAAGSSALDILRDRFARGEIDKAEFEDRKKALGA